MTETQIINTINKELASGSTKEATIEILEIQGYPQTEIDKAFALIEAVNTPKTELPTQELPTQPVTPPTSVIETPQVVPTKVEPNPIITAPTAPIVNPTPVSVNQEQLPPLHLENSLPSVSEVSKPNVETLPPIQTPTFVPNQVEMTSIPPFIAQQETPIVPPTKSHTGIIVSLVIVFLLITSGVALAYYKQIGPFKVNQYSENSLLSGLLEKSSSIDTSTFSMAVKLNVNGREKDAIPFVPPVIDEKTKQQYQNDVKRMSDIAYILQSFKYEYGDIQGYDFKTKKYIITKSVPYPANLSGIEGIGKDNSSSGYFYPRAGTTTSSSNSKIGYDPVTQQLYEYKPTEESKNFSIQVNFETDTAINEIRKSYYYSATSTIINGKIVTFSKDSGYINISSELPDPILVTLSNYLKQISPDVSASVLFGATLDVKNLNSPDGSMSVSADGSFGDLTYKVDIEALKKDKDYYFRINKIPAIISSISNMKGQWIKISPTATSTATSTDSSYGYDPITMFSESVSKGDEAYRKKRTDFINTLKSVAQLADKNKLFTFKQNPKKEKVDGRNLIRYDLSVKKEAILPFYKEISSNPEKYKNIGIINDPGLITYLESKEFDDTFKFIQDNTFITIWTDSDGLPAIVEYRMRIVPADTATQLKNKQVDVIFRISVDNINKPIDIKVPNDAKPIEKIREEMNKNSGFGY
ncbi:TPA: hypothetical protein DEP94_03925 [Candidatus Nomurabacteria bacterium]|nr:hypothetical protein [Candidatus Nomurabacteria bacterium]